MQFPEASQSQLGPLASRSTPLPPQFAQPMHSILVSSQPPVACLPLAPPFGHETRSLAPWQSNVGFTVSTAPGFAQSGTPYYFPLRCRVIWGLVPLPHLSDSTRSFDSAMVIGPGFNPVPHRLVTAITSGHYVDLAALLASPSEESSVPTLTLNLSKSTGPFSIPTKLLKTLRFLLCGPLTYLFNCSILTGVVPDKLKIARVIPVYKKGPKVIVSNYRPISLLSIFNKILEKLICKRLLHFLEQNHVLFDG